MSNRSEALDFGTLIRTRREALGMSLRGLAAEIGIKPSYMSDIEKGNRPAPEKYLDKLLEVLLISQSEAQESGGFYDLATKSRKGLYQDLMGYLGKTDLARVALRMARDQDISDETWQHIIDAIEQEKSMDGR
jgi:transcriptional regulator with XRE-family HTH domain